MLFRHKKFFKNFQTPLPILSFGIKKNAAAVPVPCEIFVLKTAQFRETGNIFHYNTWLFVGSIAPVSPDIRDYMKVGGPLYVLVSYTRETRSSYSFQKVVRWSHITQPIHSMRPWESSIIGQPVHCYASERAPKSASLSTATLLRELHGFSGFSSRKIVTGY
jgi:hypothetical protein